MAYSSRVKKELDRLSSNHRLAQKLKKKTVSASNAFSYSCPDCSSKGTSHSFPFCLLCAPCNVLWFLLTSRTCTCSVWMIFPRLCDRKLYVRNLAENPGESQRPSPHKSVTLPWRLASKRAWCWVHTCQSNERDRNTSSLYCFFSVEFCCDITVGFAPGFYGLVQDECIGCTQK